MQESIFTDMFIKKSICLRIVVITFLFSITGAVVEGILYASNNCGSAQPKPYY